MHTERYDRPTTLLNVQKLNPRVPDISLNVGWAYYHEQRFGLAIPEFAQLLHAQPDSCQARYLVGMSYFLNGDYQNAEQSFKPLESAEQDNLDFLIALGICNRKLN